MSLVLDEKVRLVEKGAAHISGKASVDILAIVRPASQVPNIEAFAQVHSHIVVEMLSDVLPQRARGFAKAIRPHGAKDLAEWRSGKMGARDGKGPRLE